MHTSNRCHPRNDANGLARPVFTARRTPFRPTYSSAALAILAGATVPFVVGCAPHRGYPPGPYGGYPAYNGGTYLGSPSSIPQGTVPNGNYSGPQLTPIPEQGGFGNGPLYNTPQNTGPSNTVPPGSTSPGGSPPQIEWDSPSGNDAPPFSTPGSTGGGTPNNNNLVPDYRDFDDFGPGNSGVQQPDDEDDLFSPFGMNAPGGNVQQVNAQSDPFQVPVFSPGNREVRKEGSGVRFASTQPAPPIARPAVPLRLDQPGQVRPNPYAYDHEEHRWLRGIADFDPRDGTWNIIYSLVPDEDDPYAGSLTLLPSPALDKARSGDVLLLQGHIDASRPDRTGKPMYHVDKCERYHPRS